MCICSIFVCAVCVYKCQRHVFSMPHLSANTPAAINYAKSSYEATARAGQDSVYGLWLLVQLASWHLANSRRRRQRHR